MKRMNELKPSETGVISAIKTKGSMRRRFLDLGLCEDTLVECIGKSPGGDPSAYLIRGVVYAIRDDDCSDIFIK